MYTRRYTQAQNETASPERRMVLLFEAAVRHIRAAAEAFEAGGSDGQARVTKALDIVSYLDATFDRARYPDLAANVGAVYQFTCQRLIAASATRDPRLLREAETVFAPVADAFGKAVQTIAAGATP